MRHQTASIGSITRSPGISCPATSDVASGLRRPDWAPVSSRGRPPREAVDAIAAHWGEAADGAGFGSDPVYDRVVDWLTGAAPKVATTERRKRRLPIHAGGVIGWTRRHGLPLRKSSRTLPRRCAYINASQFPLWVASSFEWLEERRDISALFFMHDLLPVLMPEYFREAEFERHQKRLRNFARFGTAAIVTTKTVAADLAAHMASLGRHDVPIFQPQRRSRRRSPRRARSMPG